MSAALLSLIAVLSSLGTGAFALAVDQHGVRVYQRTDPRLIELYADGEFPASPERVRAEMLDYARTPSWVKELAESTIVSTGEHTLDVYQRLKLPVVADRDYTLRVTWGQDGAVLWLRFVAVSEYGPPLKKGVVRMPLHEGIWRFEPDATGTTTHAHYEMRMDLGGSLPVWMARRRAAQNVPVFFESLRTRLRP